MEDFLGKWALGIVASLFAFGITLIVNQLLKRLQKLDAKIERLDKQMLDSSSAREVERSVSQLQQSIRDGFHGISLGMLTFSYTIIALARDNPSVDVKQIEALQDLISRELHEQMQYRDDKKKGTNNRG